MRTSKWKYALDADYRLIDAKPLEDLIETPDFMCKVLFHKNWNGKMYLLNKRDDWTDDRYFRYADEKLKQQDIDHLR